MLAVFNPCGFPLLPAYLEFFAGGKGRPTVSTRALGAVSAGALSVLGFVVVFGCLGAVTELGWSAFADHALGAARYVMVGVGLALAALGAAWLAGRPPRLPVPAASLSRARGPVLMLAFGLVYAVASLGCALPLFVSGIAVTFTREGVLSGTEVFVCYALGMGTVLMALAVLVAVAGPTSLRPLRRVGRAVPFLGGALLVAVGLYLAGYWLTAIVQPDHSVPLEHWVTGAQSWAATLVSGHARAVATTCGGMVIAALMAGGLRLRARR